MRSIFKKNKNESGIALLLVISSLVVLMMITTELAYNAQIEYQIALKQRQRLQAYYMALSAYQMARLQIKVNDPILDQVGKAVEALATAGFALPIDSSTPLCQQFPLQTAFFRMAAISGFGAPAKEGGEASAEADPTASLLAGMTLQGVDEFMKFDGDFESACVDEGSKLNLNYFYEQDPRKEVFSGVDNPYDDYKKLILKILQESAYQKYFEESQVTPADAVRNIADWVDTNGNINDFGGGERGGEESEYKGTSVGQMTVKNGKFSTPEDVYRVAGVSDIWWKEVKDLFTIYGSINKDGKGQVNICRAPDAVVRGLILRYIELRKDIPPLKPEDDEIIEKLIETVKAGCFGSQPDKNQIAADLDAKIGEFFKIQAFVGGVGEGAGAEERPPPEESGEEGSEGEEKPKESQGGGGSVFADWITTESRFFGLEATGRVKDTSVTIKTVIDLGEERGKDIKKWKTLYWKVY